MKQKNGLPKIWGIFSIFIILFVINLGIKTDISPTSMMWLILAAGVMILSIVMLIKNKLPNNRQMLISLIFGLLMILAYQGISFTSIQACIITVFSLSASFSIFNKYKDNAIKLLRNESVTSISLSIIIGIALGVALGIINLFLGNDEPNLKITLSGFLTALSPAIYEEIAFRAFLYAICLYFLNGKIETKKENFACWFMMIIPHVMVHTPEMFITDGVVSGIIGILMLTLLFGLPFAFLQRKRDLTSAMIAHGVVMVIRFCFLGVPI